MNDTDIDSIWNDSYGNYAPIQSAFDVYISDYVGENKTRMIDCKEVQKYAKTI
jgi:hypothetical protein